MDLERRKREKLAFPLANAPPKYSTIPHPLMRLSRLALPTGSDPETIEKAVEIFSSSVTRETQGGYATATRHYFAAERALGRKFEVPPTELEYIFLTTYLMNQNLSVCTIRSYLAGIRFYLLSLGVTSPPKLPQLAEQLLVGMKNQTSNPIETASKKTRRAITARMLKIIGHGIAVTKEWSSYEKSLRWAVVLVAWWGSFRIGELLTKSKANFHPGSTLLASDVKLSEESIAFWIRSPKIKRQSTGDVVEVAGNKKFAYPLSPF